MIAAQFPSNENDWYPDIRAINHLTNDGINLYISMNSYDGQDYIQVSNNVDLKIVRSGTFIFSYPFKSFVFNKLLLMPEIHKNILFVHHFYLENNVFFLISCFFLVKDYLRNIRHREPLSNGLYSFSTFITYLQPQDFSGVRVYASL